MPGLHCPSWRRLFLPFFMFGGVAPLDAAAAQPDPLSGLVVSAIARPTPFASAGPFLPDTFVRACYGGCSDGV